MRIAPQISSREIAKYLLDEDDGPSLRGKYGVTTREAVENWLSTARKLAQSGEPLDVGINSLRELWPQVALTEDY
jgi:hypothetical protein